MEKSFYIENKNVGNRGDTEDWRGKFPNFTPYYMNMANQSL